MSVRSQAEAVDHTLQLAQYRKALGYHRVAVSAHDRECNAGGLHARGVGSGVQVAVPFRARVGTLNVAKTNVITCAHDRSTARRFEELLAYGLNPAIERLDKAP